MGKSVRRRLSRKHACRPEACHRRKGAANGKQKQYKNKYLSDPTNREANRKAALEYYRSHRAERHEYYERTKERREQRRRERLADPSTNLKARQALWSFQRRARRAKASVGDATAVERFYVWARTTKSVRCYWCVVGRIHRSATSIT